MRAPTRRLDPMPSPRWRIVEARPRRNVDGPCGVRIPRQLVPPTSRRNVGSPPPRRRSSTTASTPTGRRGVQIRTWKSLTDPVWRTGQNSENSAPEHVQSTPPSRRTPKDRRAEEAGQPGPQGPHRRDAAPGEGPREPRAHPDHRRGRCASARSGRRHQLCRHRRREEAARCGDHGHRRVSLSSLVRRAHHGQGRRQRQPRRTRHIHAQHDEGQVRHGAALERAALRPAGRRATASTSTPPPTGRRWKSSSTTSSTATRSSGTTRA